jgi:integrase
VDFAVIVLYITYPETLNKYDNLINRLEQTEMRAVLEEERRVCGRQNLEPLAATSSVTALQIAEVLGVNVEDIQFGTNLISELISKI